MEVDIVGPYDSLTPSDLEVLDDVVSSFSESVDSVLKTNFAPQKKTESQVESVLRTGSLDVGITKNQKIASVFCRQWLSGILNLLTHKLVEDGSEEVGVHTIPIPTEPEFIDDLTEFESIDDIGIAVENARICGNGQVEVNYEMNEFSDTNMPFSPKLKAKELMQLILQGKQTESALHKNLETFWRSSPALLMKILDGYKKKSDTVSVSTREARIRASSRKNDRTPAPLPADSYLSGDHATGGDGGVSSGVEETVSIDDESLRLLNEILKGGKDSSLFNEDVEELLSTNPQVLIDYSSELGIVGMPRLIELYNKVKSEIIHVSKLARFYSKFALDLNDSNKIR